MMDTKDYKNCPTGKYHAFKVLRSPYVNPNEVAQQEQCKYCKVIKVYHFKPNGKMIEEEAYLLDHIREFAQPFMSCYYDINPGAMFEFITEEQKKRKSEEFQGEQSEKFKFAIKQALLDKDAKI